MKVENIVSQGTLDQQQKPITDRTVRVLADSIYEQLRSEGCRPRDIISVSSQLLGLVTDTLQHESED